MTFNTQTGVIMTQHFLETALANIVTSKKKSVDSVEHSTTARATDTHWWPWVWPMAWCDRALTKKNTRCWVAQQDGVKADFHLSCSLSKPLYLSLCLQTSLSFQECLRLFEENFPFTEGEQVQPVPPPAFLFVVFSFWCLPLYLFCLVIP